MDDTAKYLIHADITTDGVVERSDVVGAVFGQTEGLLGDDLDLRDLQQTSKVGRIDVDIDSQNGQSYGTVTISTSLDKVETAILSAALETIGRVGPCRASVSIDSIEDVRAAKRKDVVDRAKELLSTAFEDNVMTSEQILEEVRESVRVDRITEYEGLPAGPRVRDSDAIIIVEGRSDVLTLLRYGVKNAIAVEGTNVPDEVAELTQDRTVTTFLDGDRGGELILKELTQVGNVDYVALAPPGKSVEDLTRNEAMSALRGKVPLDAVGDSPPSETDESLLPATDGSTRPAPEPSNTDTPDDGFDFDRPDQPDARTDTEMVDELESDDASTDPEATVDSAGETEADESDAEPAERHPQTLPEHIADVIDDETDTVRLLDAEFDTLDEANADDAFDTVAEAADIPTVVVLDGALSQRLLDVAAQRGVGQIIAREKGQFTKRPTDVRIRLADAFQSSD